jgi:hypothetical protein
MIYKIQQKESQRYLLTTYHVQIYIFYVRVHIFSSNLNRENVRLSVRMSDRVSEVPHQHDTFFVPLFYCCGWPKT